MKTIKRNFFSLFLMLTAYSVVSQSIAKNNLIYQADSNGRSTFGTINSLIEAVQNGKQIRVGFAMGPIEHWTDTGFVTIYEGHVFAQIEGIFQQHPSLSDDGKIPKVEFANKNDDSWSAIIGTTGVMQMHWDLNEEKLLKHFKSQDKLDAYVKSLKKMKVTTKWAAF